MPKPLSFYTTCPEAQMLAEHHGEFLQNATDQQLRELLTCYAAGMTSARCSDMEVLHLMQALIAFLEHRIHQPIVRIEHTSSTGEAWV
jgi:hypothetical protein